VKLHRSPVRRQLEGWLVFACTGHVDQIDAARPLLARDEPFATRGKSSIGARSSGAASRRRGRLPPARLHPFGNTTTRRCPVRPDLQMADGRTG